MKQVTINGVSYLGEIKDKDGTLELSMAMATAGQAITRNDVSNYLQKLNLEDLETITFGGNGASYTVQDLTDEVEMFFKMGELVMAQAKKVAVKNLVNTEFTKSLGKI